MGKWRWMAFSFGAYALLPVLAFALSGTLAFDWSEVVAYLLVFPTVASVVQGVIGLCFDRAHPAALLIGGIASWSLLVGAIWLFTFGPVGTRSDEHYGRQTASEYAAWLRKHGDGDAIVSGCRPIRDGLEMYGRPGYYSCVVDSTAHCLLLYKGFADFGPMSPQRCAYFVND